MSIPSDLKDRLASGGYARKQFFCKSRVIAWSHTSRFAMARKLVEPFVGRGLLDYGCGDGSFLALVHDLFPVAVGADPDSNEIRDNAARFADWPGLSFLNTADLDEPRHERAYGLITCMEVLEHCPPEAIDEILARFRRLLAPGGVVLISVPIEIGPILVIKEAIRTVAGWRRLGDYGSEERYRPGEFLKMVFAGERTAIPRPSYPFEFSPGRFAHSYGHLGFNWKALRNRLRREFDIEPPRFTPLGWSRGLVSSQVWLTCRPKP